MAKWKNPLSDDDYIVEDLNDLQRGAQPPSASAKTI